MKTASFLNQPPVFVEIGPDSLRARHNGKDMELPLERGADGRLTVPGKEKISAALKDFLRPRNWLPRPRAWCAIGSRGVSLRRLSFPGGSKEDFQQRLLLQIEAEFPLPPDELAWGSQPVGPPKPANGALGRHDLLVAAIKKESLADYYEVLRACGTDPVFTLAATARRSLIRQPMDSFAMLDIGARQSELTIFENAVPTISRIIFWDGKNAANPSNAELDALVQPVKGSLTGSTLFVSGNVLAKDFPERLAWSIGNGCKCQRLETAPAGGGSPAVAGLESLATTGDTPALTIRLEQANVATAGPVTLDWKLWGRRAGALAAAALLLPYIEALALRPHLEKKVAEFKAEAERLTVIDREKDFLDSLKLNQPPYLDLLYVFSKSAPPGTKFDSLSMNSHGEVSLRCAFRDGQQVADFRDKLIASGFFTNVVVEEQIPSVMPPQKVNVRMTAQEKAPAELQVASARLVMDDPNKNAKAAMPGVPTAGPAATPVIRKDSK